MFVGIVNNGREDKIELFFDRKSTLSFLGREKGGTEEGLKMDREKGVIWIRKEERKRGRKKDKREKERR